MRLEDHATISMATNEARQLMSGSRQHVVPQFLIRPFASRQTGGGHYVWVYSKDKDPYEANTLNVFVEKNFYSSGEDSSADDAMTALESKFATLLNRLISEKVGPIDEISLFDFIAHLEIRSRNFRHSFAKASGSLITALLDHVEQPGNVGRLLFEGIKRQPEYLISEIMKTGLSRKQAKFMADYLVRHKSEFLAQSQDKIEALINHLKMALPSKIPQSTKNGHLRLLADGLPPKLRVERYNHLNLSTVEVRSGDLVLGDNPVLFGIGESGEYKFFTDKDDEVTSLIFPLSPQRLLFGSIGQQSPDPESLREIIASHSIETFVSRESTTANQALTSKIGTKAELFTKKEISKIAEDQIREAMGL